MGIKASISGTNNINYDFHYIMSVCFRHLTPLSSYTKSNDATYELILEISANFMFEHSPNALKALREWENETPSSDTYYRNLDIQEVYADEIIRQFTFSQAYIERTHTKTLTDVGKPQIIELIIRQKRDKFREINIK